MGGETRGVEGKGSSKSRISSFAASFGTFLISEAGQSGGFCCRGNLQFSPFESIILLNCLIVNQFPAAQLIIS